MYIVVIVLWCIWAVAQLAAAAATATGKDVADALSPRLRAALSAGFVVSAAGAVAAGIGHAIWPIVVAVAFGLGCPLLVGILTNSVRVRHHLVRLALLACLVALTGVRT